MTQFRHNLVVVFNGYLKKAPSQEIRTFFALYLNDLDLSQSVSERVD